MFAVEDNAFRIARHSIITEGFITDHRHRYHGDINNNNYVSGDDDDDSDEEWWLHGSNFPESVEFFICSLLLFPSINI